MPHPGHQRKTVGTDPSAKRLGTYQSKPAKKKSLGIKGAAGIISAKALKGLKWPGSPQASKLALDVVGPGGYKKKLATTIAKKVAPTAVKKVALTVSQKADKAWDRARAVASKEHKIYTKLKDRRTAALKAARGEGKRWKEDFKKMYGRDPETRSK